MKAATNAAMRRKGDIPLLVMAITFSFSFFVPLAPVDFGKTWAGICHPDTTLCSTGVGMFFHGYGSLTYQLFGVGGAWYSGKYEILHNGCYVATGVSVRCTISWKPAPPSPTLPRAL